MKIYILIFNYMFFSNVIWGQKGFPKYYELIALQKKADSLYKAKDFRSAAYFYTAATNVVLEKAIPWDYSEFYYNASCSWALANFPDSALDHLEILATKMKYAEYKQLLVDADLKSLHNDPRWTPIIERVKSNAETKKRLEKNYQERTKYLGGSKEIIFYPHTEYMKQFIDNDTLPLISINYENFRICFRGNSYAALHLNEIKQELSSAFQKILTIVDTAEYYRGINLILLDSPEENQQLTGIFTHGGTTLPAGYDMIFFNCNDKRRLQFKHEIFHFIASDIWGHTSSRLLNEGGAVYTDNECFYENAIYSINAYMLKENKLFAFNSLINEFDIKARESEFITYTESAGIFKYLYEKYGSEKMKQLWIKGFNDFESIYKKSFFDFEKEWKEFISTILPPKNIDWNMLIENGCG